MLAQDSAREVLLGRPVPLVAVRVIIAHAMSQPFGIAAGIHQVNRHGANAVLLNLRQGCVIGKG